MRRAIASGVRCLRPGSAATWAPAGEQGLRAFSAAAQQGPITATMFPGDGERHAQRRWAGGATLRAASRRLTTAPPPPAPAACGRSAHVACCCAAGFLCSARLLCASACRHALGSAQQGSGLEPAAVAACLPRTRAACAGRRPACLPAPLPRCRSCPAGIGPEIAQAVAKIFEEAKAPIRWDW